MAGAESRTLEDAVLNPNFFISRPIISLCAVLLLLFFTASAQALELKSPDGRITLKFEVSSNGAPYYSVKYGDQTLLQPSRLGLRFQAQTDMDAGFGITNNNRKSRLQTWEQPWGERWLVKDEYNELRVDLETADQPSRYLTLRFRAYNDGIGFRYEVPRQPGYEQVNIVDEITEFHLAEDGTAWWIPGRRFNRYEYLYNSTGLDAIETAHTPMTMRFSSGVHISLHEAALTDYAAYVLDQRRPRVLQTDLTPWSDGVRVKTQTPFKTPWRTIQIAPDAVGLLNSDLILNLNEPNALGDVSWVQPGKYIGIWWAMHIRQRTWGSGPQHGATTAETKRYLDFAAKYGFDGVLVEGWNIGWDGDWFHNGDLFKFHQPYPDFDLPELSRYAQSKGVRLIGHHETSGNISNYEQQLEAGFDLYQSMGVRQVKTGYVADASDIKRLDDSGKPHYEWHDGQLMVNHYLEVVKQAAKRQISINTHEPIKDTGLRRTYPNWITREGARGQEFNAWGDPPNPPEHTVILPWTRMLSGPMDFTPGIFDLTFQGKDSKQRVQTTLAKQLALYVVLYSPIQMAADLPENYEKRLDAFQFIRDVPTDWEQSLALAGEVGDYLLLARKERQGEDWYLGAVSDEQARAVDVDLSFLDADVSYTAQIYRDGDSAHWQQNPYAIVIEQRELKRGDAFRLQLAAGGGAAVRLIPQRR